MFLTSAPPTGWFCAKNFHRKFFLRAAPLHYADRSKPACGFANRLTSAAEAFGGGLTNSLIKILGIEKYF
jgi:hypothetical protein